jgi:cobalt/nickel transport system ATP-binding protein
MVSNIEQPLLKLSNVCFSYQDNANIVKNLNLSLSANEKVGIIGATGGGKSTLLHMIMGLLPVNAGIISIFGMEMKEEKDFASVRTKIGFLFQHADDQLFSPTVLDDIVFGPLNQGKTPEEALAIACELLDLFGMSSFKDRITHKLSGGEKKMVALATALAMKPGFLLLDEPVTGLDPVTKNKIIDLLKKLSIPSIVISHDWEFLKQVTNKTYKLENGQLFSDVISSHNSSR